MNELAFTLLRLGYLLILWIFLGMTMRVLLRDMGGLRPLLRRRGALAPSASLSHGSNGSGSGTGPVHGRRRGATKIVITEGPLAGSIVPLTPSSIIIGRSPSCTLVLNDDYASGRHARIFPQDGSWWVEDLGSTNGTLVGDTPISDTVELPIGVSVRIGQTRLELRP